MRPRNLATPRKSATHPVSGLIAYASTLPTYSAPRITQLKLPYACKHRLRPGVVVLTFAESIMEAKRAGGRLLNASPLSVIAEESVSPVEPRELAALRLNGVA